MPDSQTIVHVNTPDMEPGSTEANIRPFVHRDRFQPDLDAGQDASQKQGDWEIPVAKATLQLVAAYRHLHCVAPQTLPPRVVPSFRAVCRLPVLNGGCH